MGYVFDGINKKITLTSGTVEFDVRDLYSRWVDWWLTGDNSKYLIAFSTTGGEDINVTDGTSIPIYSFLKNGWRIKPQEADHNLIVKGGILLVAGGGEPFLDTDSPFLVQINYQQPVQVITIDTSGGAANPTAADIAAAVWATAASGHSAGSIGDIISKVLTVGKFLGLK